MGLGAAFSGAGQIIVVVYGISYGNMALHFEHNFNNPEITVQNRRYNNDF